MNSKPSIKSEIAIVPMDLYRTWWIGPALDDGAVTVHARSENGHVITFARCSYGEALALLDTVGAAMNCVYRENLV